MSAARIYQLSHRYSISRTGDLIELSRIHHHLFQDVYDWAGKVRTVDLRKNTPGADPFVPAALIGRAAGFCAEELAGDQQLRGLDRTRFIERLTHHYDQINHLHPFREGNGRTQRVFWSRIAADAGWPLDWRTVAGHTNDIASRAAGAGDLVPLTRMVDAITSAASNRSRRAAFTYTNLALERPDNPQRIDNPQDRSPPRRQ